MKRFLDKTWTKVAAFILFFVFLGLSIAGSVGIYFLAANDVYLAGSEASRQILYDGQASDVMTTVIDGLYNCSDNEALRDWLLERVTSDFTLRGLVAELAERGVKVDYVQVWRFAHAEGLSFKKKRAACRTAPPRHRAAAGAVEEVPRPA